MIDVQVRRVHGRVTGFTVHGHAGYAPRGEDIVCAAVSALTDTVTLSLLRLAGVAVRVEAREGHLACSLPEVLEDDAAERADLLINTLLLGVEEIARAYPGRLRLRDPGRRGESDVPV